MSNKKRIEVNIAGRKYNLIGDGSEEEIIKVVTHVNESIADVKNKNVRLGDTDTIILSTLNITGEFIKLKDEFDKLNSSLNGPAERNEKLKEQMKIIDELNKKLAIDVDLYEEEIIKLEEEKKKMTEHIEKLKRDYDEKERLYIQRDEKYREIQDKSFKAEMELIETKKEISRLSKIIEEGKEKL